MDYQNIFIFVFVFIITFAIIYKISNAFRYAIKFAYLFMLVMITGLICVVPFSFRPRDVTNIEIPAIFWNFMFKAAGLKHHIENAEYLQYEKPCVIVCNHQSSLDLIAMMKYLPKRFSALAKKELLYSPFGVSAWLAGLVFVDRLNREKSRHTMEKTAELLHEKNLKLWIFPEGTRNLRDTLLPFKKGAFHLAVQAQVPIIPIVLSSYRHFLSGKYKVFNEGEVIMSVLPPVETQGLTAENVTELAEEIRQKMILEFAKVTAKVEENAMKSNSALLNLIQKNT